MRLLRRALASLLRLLHGPALALRVDDRASELARMRGAGDIPVSTDDVLRATRG